MSDSSKVSSIVEWEGRIKKARIEDCGASVADYRFAVCRIRCVKGENRFDISNLDIELKNNTKKSGVLYWMNRDQRVQDNWALLFAQRVAVKFSVPLHVCFNLSTSSALRTRRHIAFQLGGLAEVEEECNKLNIGFHLLPLTSKSGSSVGKRDAQGNTFSSSQNISPIIDLVESLKIGVVVTDFCPLREDVRAVQMISDRLPPNIPFYQVDAHNVVPVWHASDKLEYAARTIRRKLHEKSTQLLTNFPPVVSHPVISEKPSVVDWKTVAASVNGFVDESVTPVEWAQPGTKAAFKELHQFLNHRLAAYATMRNDPTKNALSNLSPWFHFGHISVQRCLLETQVMRKHHKESVDAFIEEAFVRRELSENFCYYNSHYDSVKGAWSWAQETLKKHASDDRKPTYNETTIEKGETGDDLWNAAQHQLIREGKMHGFLRMYWAKKILEWHASGPENALALAIKMNDNYSLDGFDPNGFVGVMWSICGIHDQGWSERAIFGKIRYMNYAGCKRKFDTSAFIKKYQC